MNNSIVNITYNTTGATGAFINGLPAGVTGSWASNVFTISGTPTVSGTFNYTITLRGGCGVVTKTGSITVNDLPTVEGISAPTALCSGSSLNPTAPTVTANGSTVTAQGWQLETAVGSDAFSNLAMPYTVAFADNGKKIRYYATNSCGTINSNQVTITINDITGVTGLTNTTECLGANYSYTVSVSSSAVVSYQWNKSVTSGVWNVVSNGGAYSGATTATLSINGGTPNESADYSVDVTFASGCVVNSSTRKLTFLSQSPAPVVNIIQPNCGSSNGSITVTVQNADDQYSFDGGSTFQSSNVQSGLGNYNIVTKNSLGCVSLPKTCNLEMSASTWNGSSWSPSAPTIGDTIVFDGNYSSTGDLSGCSCLVKSGNVVINSAHTLSLQNAIVVTGGTFILENNASLIQVNGVSNSGSITVKRDSTPMAMDDYTYWSSPTSGTQTLKNFASKSNPKFMLTYDNKWIYMSSSSVFSKGIGYSILAPEPYTYTEPMVSSNQFVGVPNNGDVSVPVTYLSSLSSKLVGNPYPSAIDADKFITENSATTTGTLYFWTHNHTKTGSGYSADYAAYNITGGTAISSGHGNTNAPTKWIASGQGFVVSVKASGNVVFNNSMRVKDNTYSNTNFYRSASIVNSDKVLEKHRIWINLVNDENAFSQTLRIKT